VLVKYFAQLAGTSKKVTQVTCRFLEGRTRWSRLRLPETSESFWQARTTTALMRIIALTHAGVGPSPMI
jgi:hypothetical protein